MSFSNRISIIDALEKNTEDNKSNSREYEVEKKKPADFEAAIAASGYGKFQYLLFLAIIPASWASSFDTANMSMILPSAECDLQLSIFHKGVLNAVTYVGMVLSGFMWGYLADVRGRRGILIYGYLADGVCNFLSGFSQGFWTLVFFKFVSGFLVSGPYASIMAYCSEFYGIKERARIPLFVGFSVSFGCIVNAALAWLVIPQNWSIVLFNGAFVYNSWRIFLSLCGVPMLCGVFFLWFFPESPKFLMSRGRNEDALKVFKLIYKVNTGKSADDYPIKELEDETISRTTAGSPVCPKNTNGLSQMKAIFFYPHLPRLLLVVTMQFGGMLAMNTIRLWQPQLFALSNNFDSLKYNLTMEGEPTFCEIVDLTTAKTANEVAIEISEEFQTCDNIAVSDSVYIDTIVISATSNVFLLMASILLNTLNHKNLLYISYGVSLICLVSLNWSTNASLTLVLACLFVGLMSTTVNIVIAAGVIIFPTSLRTMAVSLEMMVGRTGSIIGNLLFPILLAYGCVAPIIALAVFTLTCFSLTCFLPIGKESMK